MLDLDDDGKLSQDPDVEVVGSGSRDKTVRIWDVASRGGDQEAGRSQ